MGPENMPQGRGRGPKSRGAPAHRDNPAGLWHLVVDLAQRRRHFVGQRASDNHDVRLALHCGRDMEARNGV